MKCRFCGNKMKEIDIGFECEICYLRNLHFEYRDTQILKESIRQKVWERDKGECVMCGFKYKLVFAHIIPKVSGGATIEDNLELKCVFCNTDQGPRIQQPIHKTKKRGKIIIRISKIDEDEDCYDFPEGIKEKISELFKVKKEVNSSDMENFGLKKRHAEICLLHFHLENNNIKRKLVRVNNRFLYKYSSK